MLLFASCFSEVTKIEDDESCPIKSEYCFFSIHEDLNRCNVQSQQDYCKSAIISEHKYCGYEPIKFYAYQFSQFDKEKLFSAKALDIDFLGETSEIDFSKFTNLEYLRIESIKELPKEIYELENLKVLWIDGGKFTEVSDDLINLKNLTSLTICSGDHIEKMTSKIGKLEKLEHLTICRLYSMDSLSIDFSNLINLKRLDLWDCDIKLNKTLLACQQLYYLETQAFLDWFIEFPNLRILGIDRVESESSIASLKLMNQLEELCIHYYSLPYVSQSISKIPNLKLLSLSFPNWNEQSEINREKNHFPKLEYLAIFNNNLDDLPDFKMPKVRYLNIVDTDNKNNIQSAKALKKYKSLRFLRLTIGENDRGLDLENDMAKKFKIVIEGKRFPSGKNFF